jgi:hypothetical protein
MRGESAGCSPGRRNTVSLYASRLVGNGEKVLVSVAMVALNKRMVEFPPDIDRRSYAGTSVTATTERSEQGSVV